MAPQTAVATSSPIAVCFPAYRSGWPTPSETTETQSVPVPVAGSPETVLRTPRPKRNHDFASVAIAALSTSAPSSSAAETATIRLIVPIADGGAGSPAVSALPSPTVAYARTSGPFGRRHSATPWNSWGTVVTIMMQSPEQPRWAIKASTYPSMSSTHDRPVQWFTMARGTVKPPPRIAHETARAEGNAASGMRMINASPVRSSFNNEK